jgi:hypothetical protein
VTPVNGGYVFTGWVRKAAGAAGPVWNAMPWKTTTDAAAVPTPFGDGDGAYGYDPYDYYAVFTGAYTVKYDTNGGVPATIADKPGVEWSQTKLLPASNPTWSGYILTGWKLSDGGIIGTNVTNNNAYSSLATNETTWEITLQAQWRPYDDGGGGGGGDGDDDDDIGGDDDDDDDDNTTGGGGGGDDDIVGDDDDDDDTTGGGGGGDDYYYDTSTPPSGGNLVPGDNGTYIELGPDGVPQGVWTWDPEQNVWVYEELPPAGAPRAGGQEGMIPVYFTGLVIVWIGAIAWAFKRLRVKRRPW